MNYLDDWSLYNQKNLLKAKEFVNDNFFRLVQFFNFEEESSDEEKKQILIDYFTKYPDQIKSISVYTVGNPNQMNVPRLMNIGGVIKYR
jgi:hypothetical protein